MTYGLIEAKFTNDGKYSVQPIALSVQYKSEQEIIDYVQDYYNHAWTLTTGPTGIKKYGEYISKEGRDYFVGLQITSTT